MVKLDSTLVPGERYYAEFYTNRAVASSMASNNLGMYFSDTLIVTRDRIPLFLTPQINSEEIVKSRWNLWQKVSGVFEAPGKSQYIIIGNFYHDDVTSTEKFPEGERGAYYYIDDVTVRRAFPTESLTPKPRHSEPPAPKRVLEKMEIVSTKEIKLDSIDYKVGNTVKLENIFFEFDKSALLPESKAELEKLIHILNDYPYLHIEISGHTDNVGSVDYNQKLSEARAKSVVDYLLQEKVESTRLSHRGFGSSQPIVTNDSEDGRATNRRVQFTILSN
jgi:outer membrane protein OmpA-like peptidoglycan-associated protein